MFGQALDDLQILYNGGVSRTGWGGCVRKEDILLWSGSSGCSVTATFDIVGVGLARGYANGSLSWDFCDAAANDLFSVLIEFYTDDGFDVDEPKQFWKYYEAFDLSETVEAEQAAAVAIQEINQFLQEILSVP